MKILGISCFYHDSAAALVVDGVLRAAAQEERFSGIKHDAGFPGQAIEFCLDKTGCGINDLDHIVFYDKPLTKFDRILSSYLATVPFSYNAFRTAMPAWLRRKLWLPQIIKKDLDYGGSVLFIDHHLSHAAGAFYSSPFEKAAILTVDGVGEWATASIGQGFGNEIRLRKAMNYPHSVGLLYSAFTYFLGFQVNSAEYKVMGLAPYGKPLYADLIKDKIVRIFDDGSLQLNLHYFRFHYGLAMVGRRFERLFGRPRRLPESDLTDSDRNLAASVQAVTEEILLKMAAHCREVTGEPDLCLSGGVALNCAAAGKLVKSNLYDRIYIQPAATDSGGAAGAAIYVDYSLTGRRDKIRQPYFSLGPAYTREEITSLLTDHRIPFGTESPGRIVSRAATALAGGKIVALFHRSMEFGPRALGFRSILADPRQAAMKERINRAVKFREPFRPFAPVVIEEKAGDYFEPEMASPYMLFNFHVRESARKLIPAVTHVDGSARIQTVRRDNNPLLYDILGEFEKLTGVPVLLNTSLNLRGRPIARTPRDALATFVSSGIDLLIMENIIIDKSELDSVSLNELKLSAGQD